MKQGRKKERRSMAKLKRAAVFLVLLFIMNIPLTVMAAPESSDKITISMIGKYDSADTAAIRSVDTDKKVIRFRNHNTGKNYTLTYDNTSMMYDARGVVLSPSLLEVGQIVDVTFLKSSKHVTTLNINKNAWVVEDTRDHDLVRGDGSARIKGELYRMDLKTLVLSEDSPILAEDILSTDTIRASGIDKEVYSVVVTGGHGYVSLSSDVVEDHSLVGAWIELDNAVIHRITPNMLLSAPEGDYKVQILGNGASYQSDIRIDRNKESVVDTTGVRIEKPKEGLVSFEITPETAEVFVDGEKMLTGVSNSVPYGYHSLKLVAEGYVTQNKYLKVGSARSVIRIEMEKEEEKKDSSESSSSSSSSDSSASSSSSADGSTEATTKDAATEKSSNNSSSAQSGSSKTSAPGEGPKIVSQTNKVIDGYKIYFDQPYDAEVYFDGSYVGQIPTSVSKISGSHEVILRREGYETKSYRVKIDTDETSLNYTFPDLVKIGGSGSSSHREEDYYDGSNDEEDDSSSSQKNSIEVIELFGDEDEPLEEDNSVNDEEEESVEIIDMNEIKKEKNGD